MFDATLIKQDFPILQQQINRYPLAYLDSAASSQKPSIVIDAITKYYTSYNANVHRGIHTLSELATTAYEKTRELVAQFIHSPGIENIIFTKGATEGLNIAARLLSENVLQPEDTVLLSLSEHHSNIVPWQLLAKRYGYSIDYIPVTSDGHFDMEVFEKIITTKRVKVVAIQHVSNVTGIIHPIEQMIQKAKQQGCYTVVDACQSAPHIPINVQTLDCDFLAFSSHKMLGPTGFGILYGRKELLEQYEPLFGGGDMISEVLASHSTWNTLPYKFEPGTPHMAGSIGFGKAIEYLNNLGMEQIMKHEIAITEYALRQLSEIKQLTVIGPVSTEDKIGVIPFTIKNIHPHDIAQILDQYGVAIRVGHHCAQLLHRSLCLNATARISTYLYTTKEDIDQCVQALHKVISMFA